MPAGEVDAMIAARPAPRHYHPEVQPVLRLLRELRSRPPVERLAVEKPGFRLELRGAGVTRRAGSAQVPGEADGTGEAQRAGEGGARSG
jgi:oxaloacetate decarboxylase (Na+ extruding) subunit alpha